jgi:hypothetical protein
MRSFLVVLAIGLVALVAVGLGQKSSRVYTLGVNPALPAVALEHGDRACQVNVRPPTDEPFDRVGFLLGTSGKPGPEISVDVVDERSGQRLGTGRLAAGYPDLGSDQAEHVVPVRRIQTSEPVRLCLTNKGSNAVVAIGQVGVASPTTSGTINGEPLANDITFDLHGEERSLLARLPDIANRAARFRAGIVSPFMYLVLALAILVGAPLLLARSLARASR